MPRGGVEGLEDLKRAKIEFTITEIDGDQRIINELGYSTLEEMFYALDKNTTNGRFLREAREEVDKLLKGIYSEVSGDYVYGYPAIDDTNIQMTLSNVGSIRFSPTMMNLLTKLEMGESADIIKGSPIDKNHVSFNFVTIRAYPSLKDRKAYLSFLNAILVESRKLEDGLCVLIEGVDLGIMGFFKAGLMTKEDDHAVDGNPKHGEPPEIIQDLAGFQNGESSILIALQNGFSVGFFKPKIDTLRLGVLLAKSVKEARTVTLGFNSEALINLILRFRIIMGMKNNEG